MGVINTPNCHHGWDLVFLDNIMVLDCKKKALVARKRNEEEERNNCNSNGHNTNLPTIYSFSISHTYMSSSSIYLNFSKWKVDMKELATMWNFSLPINNFCNTLHFFAKHTWKKERWHSKIIVCGNFLVLFLSISWLLLKMLMHN